MQRSQIIKNQVHLPINPIQSYHSLRDKDEVKMFLDFLKEKTNEQLQNNECCFLVADNLKEAYLFIAFCFGGLQTVDFLPNDKVYEDVKAKLKSDLSNFEWNQKLPVLKMFRGNAAKFGNLYPYIRKQVIDKLTEQQCQQIFNKAKESIFLNGVKIRKWQFGSYTQIKRKQQEAQINHNNGRNYLLIAATKTSRYYVGVFEFGCNFDSLASVQWQNDPRNTERQIMVRTEKTVNRQQGPQKLQIKTQSKTTNIPKNVPESTLMDDSFENDPIINSQRPQKPKAQKQQTSCSKTCMCHIF